MSWEEHLSLNLKVKGRKGGWNEFGPGMRMSLAIKVR